MGKTTKTTSQRFFWVGGLEKHGVLAQMMAGSILKTGKKARCFESLSGVLRKMVMKSR